MERRVRPREADWSEPDADPRRRDGWAYGADPDYYDEPPPPRGWQVGAILITPTRVLMLLALVGSLLYLAYAITVRDASSLPLLASGAAVLGIVFAGLAVAGAFSILRAGREGADGRAFGLAILGGLCAIAAFGCWAAAVVFIMVSQSAS
jgi:hypothetical protein